MEHCIRACCRVFANARYFILIAVWATFFGGVLFSLSTPSTSAAFNPEINYQGKLTNASNVAVSNGTYEIEFNLYTQPTGGSPVWTETLDGADEVTVTNGLFSVMLGSTTALTGVDFNQTLYLGVTVESDLEMTPRKILGTVPAAFEAANSETFDNLATTSFLRSDQADTALSLLTFSNGLISQASSTIFGLTTITATTTYLVINGERFTDLTGGGLMMSGGALTANISESNLNITGSPTNGYILLASSTAAGGFVWAATSSLNISSGTNLTFGTDNQIPYMNAGGDDFDYSSSFTFSGSALTVGGDILPATTLIYDLGSASNRFANLWAETLNVGTSTWSIFNGSDGRLAFSNAAEQGGTEHLSILTSGNIGIGTTSPAYKLDVYGDARIDGLLYDAIGSAGTPGMVLQTTASGINWVATSSLGIGTETHDAATITGEDYLSISGQQITANAINVDNLSNSDFGDFSCNGTTCTLDANTIATGQIVDGTITFGDINYTMTLAGNPALGANQAFFGSTGIIFEGTTADNFEGLLTAPVTGSDKTWTLPDSTGTIALLNSAMTGTFDGNNFVGGAIGAGDLLYGSGAGSIAELPIGTNGHVLQVVAGAPAWVPVSSLNIGTSNYQTFTAGGTWTKPAGVLADQLVIVEMWGGGGSGASGGHGGGGGGAYNRLVLRASTLASEVSVTVGSGGTVGNGGGVSSFGSHGSAYGGNRSASGGGGGGGGGILSTGGSGDGGVGGSPVGSPYGGGRGYNSGSDSEAEGSTYGGGGGGGQNRTAGGSIYGGGGGCGSGCSGGTSVYGGNGGTTYGNAGSIPGGGGGGNAAGARGEVRVWVIAAGSVGADVAENYPVVNTAIEPGDIVSFDTKNPIVVDYATENDSRPLAGIISTQPGLLLDDFAWGDVVRPVALSGRVPTKVNLEGGPILPGDRIAPSSVPGMGRKAKLFEPSVGTALTPFTGADGVAHGFVTVFIDLQPGLNTDALSDVLFGASSLTPTASSTLAIFEPLHATDTIWKRLYILATNFVDGVLTLVGLKAETGTFEKGVFGELCVGHVCVDETTFLQMIKTSGAQPAAPLMRANHKNDDVAVTPEIPTEPEPALETEDEIPIAQEGGAAGTKTLMTEPEFPQDDELFMPPVETSNEPAPPPLESFDNDASDTGSTTPEGATEPGDIIELDAVLESEAEPQPFDSSLDETPAAHDPLDDELPLAA